MKPSLKRRFLGAAFIALVLALFPTCITSDDTCDASDPMCQEKEKAFFNTYSSPESQANMVLDKPRTQAYRAAIQHKLNSKLFKDKIVLDVGCGTGVLSLFAAAAGAKTVFCVELTPMASVAEQLVAVNGFSNIVQVFQEKMETVQLPVAKVDIIISEWMGYFGLFEGMFRSVLWARDKYLIEGGLLFPDKIDLLVAGAGSSPVDPKHKDLVKWDKPLYGLNFGPMRNVLQEWKQFEINSMDQQWRSGTYPQIAQLDGRALVTSEVKIASFNMETVSMKDLDHIEADIELVANLSRSSYGNTVDRLVGWFDAYFTHGGREVLLGTSPWAKATHWHQMVFFLPEPLEPLTSATDKIKGRIMLSTDGKFEREMNVGLSLKHSAGDEVRKVYTVRILPDTTNWAN